MSTIASTFNPAIFNVGRFTLGEALHMGYTALLTGNLANDEMSPLLHAVTTHKLLTMSYPPLPSAYARKIPGAELVRIFPQALEEIATSSLYKMSTLSGADLLRTVHTQNLHLNEFVDYVRHGLLERGAAEALLGQVVTQCPYEFVEQCAPDEMRHVRETLSHIIMNLAGATALTLTAGALVLTSRNMAAPALLLMACSTGLLGLVGFGTLVEYPRASEAFWEALRPYYNLQNDAILAEESLAILPREPRRGSFVARPVYLPPELRAADPMKPRRRNIAFPEKNKGGDVTSKRVRTPDRDARS